MAWSSSLLVLSTFLLLTSTSQAASSTVGRYPDLLPPSTQPSKPLFKHKRWNVDPQGGLLSVVVPVYPMPSELGALRNQLRTFARFFDTSSVAEYIIASPAADVTNTIAYLQNVISESANLSTVQFRVVSDGDCVPEMEAGMPAATENSYPGWAKQGLVKLACAKLVQTPFYLLLDTDTFFVHHAKADDLFKHYLCTEFSPVCDKARKIGYQAKNDVYPLYHRTEDQLQWLLETSKTLQLSVPLDWRAALGVTPQIVSTDVAQQLGVWIEHRFRQKSWTEYLLEFLPPAYNKGGDNGWATPWTDYMLYWVFATHVNVFEDYHTDANMLQTTAIWSEEQFNNWSPCRDTFEYDMGYFSSIQGSIGLPADKVWDKMTECFDWQVERAKREAAGQDTSNMKIGAGAAKASAKQKTKPARTLLLQ